MRIIWKKGSKSFLFLLGGFAFCCTIYFVHRGSVGALNGYYDDLMSDSPVGHSELVHLGVDRDTFEQRQKRFVIYKKSESTRKGPGEHGSSVQLTPEEQKIADAEFAAAAFNRLASDKISLQRSLSDYRMHECKALTYPEQLPSASVVIIFHNEAWSTLLRTAHSVVNRSPPRYLKEVVLLDDASYSEHLGAKLDDYVTSTWPDGVVRIVRKKTRQGLIRARLEGAKAATGDVLIFLDSHCEATEGWIEPLLARIKENRKVSIFPQIESISAHTLQYAGYPGPASNIGTFWWSLHFTWWSIPEHERQRRKKETDPLRSPTMPGGLFAMDREYFFELGAYDPGMDIWGGENLELSFRVWMCGGLLEIIPCSHVGHIFRASHPYTFPEHKDYHGINSKRLAEVWMDEYKKIFYMHRQDLITKDVGDFSDRVALREKLHCKSFQWYLDNVIPQKFNPIKNVVGYGMMTNPGNNLCLDTIGQNEFDRGDLKAGLYACQGGKSGGQLFSLTHGGEIRREWACLTVVGDEEELRLHSCVESDNPRQRWEHSRDKGTIVSKHNQKCLDTTGRKNKDALRVKPCNGSPYQQWSFETYLTPAN